ncbi:integrase_H2C2 domain-containing protein [Trichonephila clavipes]|nr:integrase_H2C2 domain-containing protein [Trichonephila clavipes]
MKCVPCRRYSSNSPMSDPVSLPADRVKDANAFDITGVDLAGPLFTRDGAKVWIVLYTCAIYRAIHLELVSSLSECFMLSLRRFIAPLKSCRPPQSGEGVYLGGVGDVRREYLLLVGPPKA